MTGLPHQSQGVSGNACPFTEGGGAPGDPPVTLIELRAEALALLTDAHKARKSHKPVSGIMRRLVRVKARVAAMETTQSRAQRGLCATP